jgi:hypothetical protein
MLALHETTRKYLCRAAFVALCVSPTLFVAAWIGGRHWPGRKGRISEEFGQRAGVHLKLADWREPRPGLVRSSGIVVSDPQTALGLIDAEGVEVRTSRRQRLFLIERATVECEQLAILAARAGTWLDNLPAQRQEIRIGSLQLKTGGSRFDLTNVQCRFEGDASGRWQGRLTGCLADAKSTDPPALRLTLAPSADRANA